MSKGLSNGTLSLRFMQNAHRAKQQAQVELEQAKVKDEAEWEVSQEIKDAWGITGSSTSSDSESRSLSGTTTTTYEASYIPFIMSCVVGEEEDGVGAVRPKGRRTFDGSGREVKNELVSLCYKDTCFFFLRLVFRLEEGSVQGEPADAVDTGPPKRITSISGFHQTPFAARHKKEKESLGLGLGPGDKSKEESQESSAKTAQQLIREDVTQRIPGLRSSRESGGFVRPVGVDGPSASLPPKGGKVGSEVPPPTPMKKRERELAAAAGRVVTGHHFPSHPFQVSKRPQSFACEKSKSTLSFTFL
ncbi:hypothetical protein BC835DRAFT_737392 [Cytidiella melzeri]|nr:hypothetical protein BC835DRAFT_737392 [Cytidiella melzeri]